MKTENPVSGEELPTSLPGYNSWGSLSRSLRKRSQTCWNGGDPDHPWILVHSGAAPNLGSPCTWRRRAFGRGVESCYKERNRREGKKKATGKGPVRLGGAAAGGGGNLTSPQPQGDSCPYYSHSAAPAGLASPLKFPHAPPCCPLPGWPGELQKLQEEVMTLRSPGLQTQVSS